MLLSADEKAHELMRNGNGILFTADAELAGLSRMCLSKMVKDAKLERARRGIYINVGELEDRLYTIQKKAQKIVYSHETALFLHKLTDRTPFRYTVTVSSGYKPSQNIKMTCKTYYIKSDLIELGKIELLSGFGNQIFVYDMERTICDIVRSRNRIDNQIFNEALKNYSIKENADFDKLDYYAKQFNVHKILHQYLEVLL